MTIVFGAVGSVYAQQNAALNTQDSPVDLIGNYLSPSGTANGPGKAYATTDPALWGASRQVSEINGVPAGAFPYLSNAREGTYTPFNDDYKWPARQLSNLTSTQGVQAPGYAKAFQFEVEAQFPRDNYDRPAAGGPPVLQAIPDANRGVRWEVAPSSPVGTTDASPIFSAGAGRDVGATTNTVAMVEMNRVSVGGTDRYEFRFRSNGFLSPVIGTSLLGATRFRVRVSFDPAGNATVTVTPMNGALGPNGEVVDMVGGPYASTSAADLAITPFAAGWISNSGESRGHAVLANFVTTGNDPRVTANANLAFEHMNNGTDLYLSSRWFVDSPLLNGELTSFTEWMGAYKSRVAAVAAGGFPAWSGQLISPATGLMPDASSAIVTMLGHGWPLQRIFGYQAHMMMLADPANGSGHSSFGAPASTSFAPGIFVYDVPMIFPYDGSYDNAPVGQDLVRAGAFSSPTMPGTDRSSFLFSMNHTVPAVGSPSAGGTVRRMRWYNLDPDAPNAPTRLQGSGFVYVPTNMREHNAVVVDEVQPIVQNLNILQDGMFPMDPDGAGPDLPTVCNGPVRIQMRVRDRGNQAASDFQGDSTGEGNGSGLARYPRVVLRPAATASNQAGVLAGDFDLSAQVYPTAPVAGMLPNVPITTGNWFGVDTAFGPTITPNALNVACGVYRLVAWAEDRVGLVSSPSTSASAIPGTTYGWDGVTPSFELRRVQTVNLTINEIGFAGTLPDAAHATSGAGGTPQFQRWVTIVIGGQPTAANQTANGANTTAPVRFERFVLLNSVGTGTVTLGAHDLGYQGFQNPPTLPQTLVELETICPDDGLWVGVKDQYHSLRNTVPLVLATIPPASCTWSATVNLILGDFNNDNFISIADYGIYLAHFGVFYSQNDITNLGSGAPLHQGPPAQYHVDASGNRRVWFEEWGYISVNINQQGQLNPGYFHSAPMRPAGERNGMVQVALLQSQGVGEAPRYDFDGNGWITMAEMERVHQLKMSGQWNNGSRGR